MMNGGGLSVRAAALEAPGDDQVGREGARPAHLHPDARRSKCLAFLYPSSSAETAGVPR